MGSTSREQENSMASMIKEPAYAYEPLTSDRSIRVLRLYGRDPKRPEAELRGLLLEHKIGPERTTLQLTQAYEGRVGDRPIFAVALSYVWNPPKLADSPPRYISMLSERSLLFDSRIEITQNCYDALIHLRGDKVDDDHPYSRLWVDAICINQQDEAEKSVQLAMMSDIYSRSQEVLVWLGRGSHETQEHFRLLRQLAKEESFLEKIGMGEWIKGMVFSGARKVRKMKQSMTAKTVQELVLGEDIMAYCFRVWTMQETMLSRNCTVAQGYDRLPWSVFYNVVGRTDTGDSLQNSRGASFVQNILCRNTPEELGGLDLLALQAQSWKLFREQNKGSDIREWPKKGIEETDRVRLIISMLIVRILQGVGVCGCFDPKDRVFGLYGFLLQLSVTMDTPDYTKSLEKIYTEATLSLLNHVGTLDVCFLSRGSDTTASADRVSSPLLFPSWAFDFRSHEPPPFFDPTYESSPTSFVGLLKCLKSARQVGLATFQVTGNRLQAQGYKIVTLMQTYPDSMPPWPRELDPNKTPIPNRSILATEITSWTSKSPEASTLSIKFLANWKQWSRLAATDARLGEFFALTAHIMFPEESPSSSFVRNMLYAVHKGDMSIADVEHDASFALMALYMHRLAGYSLCIADVGGVCLVRGGQKGDVIVLFRGGFVPFALGQEVGKEYRLLGVCQMVPPGKRDKAWPHDYEAAEEFCIV